jgi:hypothetical protein
VEQRWPLCSSPTNLTTTERHQETEQSARLIDLSDRTDCVEREQLQRRCRHRQHAICDESNNEQLFSVCEGQTLDSWTQAAEKISMF